MYVYAYDIVLGVYDVDGKAEIITHDDVRVSLEPRLSIYSSVTVISQLLNSYLSSTRRCTH